MQVLEYVSSLAPTRLNGNMPVVPKKPVIDSIGSLLDMEPEAESQTISINLAAPDPEDKLYIDNYKVARLCLVVPRQHARTSITVHCLVSACPWMLLVYCTPMTNPIPGVLCAFKSCVVMIWLP